MRNTLTPRHQKNSHALNEIDVNVKSNSMAMLMIYHGINSSTKKVNTTNDVNLCHKIVR